jgi:hypothetical protein
MTTTEMTLDGCALVKYTALPSETLEMIAYKFHVSLLELTRLNYTDDINAPMDGQQVVVRRLFLTPY